MADIVYSIAPSQGRNGRTVLDMEYPAKLKFDADIKPVLTSGFR